MEDDLESESKVKNVLRSFDPVIWPLELELNSAMRDVHKG